jgi:Type II restriction endonuclease, TdeIII
MRRNEANAPHRICNASDVGRIVWWGIPYNPYGSKALFSHPYPLTYFDFDHDVKLGPELWNFLGDDLGTYDLILELYRQVGLEFTDPLDELRETLAGRGT